jgi:hypothetical protein
MALTVAPSTWRLATSECLPCEVELPKVKACPEETERGMVACFRSTREAMARIHRQGVDSVFVGRRDGGVSEYRFERESTCPVVYRAACQGLPQSPRDGCDGGITKLCGGVEWNYGTARRMDELCADGAAYQVCDGGIGADFGSSGARAICTMIDAMRMSCVPEARWFDTIERH